MTPTATGQFESVEHARKTREILNRAWWHAYGERVRYPEEYRLVHSALGRVKDEAVRQFAVPSRSYPDMNCAGCREYSVFGGPGHGNSQFCESGRRPHCACNACF